MRPALASAFLLVLLAGTTGVTPVPHAANTSGTASSNGQAKPEKLPVAPPAVAPLGEGEARAYAEQIANIAGKVSLEYIREVSAEKLAVLAVRGLYEATGTPVPQAWQGDAEKILLGRDAAAEIARARQELGDAAAICGDNGIRISIEAMLRGLDPFSIYLHPHQRQQAATTTNLQSGVGLAVEDREGTGPLIVRSVGLGGPAQAAGIQPADRVLEIDGASTRNMAVSEATMRLGAAQGSPLTLTVQRDGESAKVIKLISIQLPDVTVSGVRRQTEKTWDYLLDPQNRIGYVRVTSLSLLTPSEVAAAMTQLQQAGLRGLILDLRDCPGGYLLQATQVADLFLDEGIIANMSYRHPTTADGRPRPTTYTATRGGFLEFPMVVLVGPETGGAGELIAAALQDLGRAQVAGQRSRGKGTIQEVTQLDGNQTHVIRLTKGMFLRPSGKKLHRFPESKRSDDWGVQPDNELEVRLSPEFRRKLREWRFRHELRAPDSRNALPLDDPEADPVLATARKHLITTR